jgi:hypothetical protein
MTVRESLEQVLSNLSDERLEQVRDFAEYLALKADLEVMQQFGREQFARAYGDNEPEYSRAGLS